VFLHVVSPTSRKLIELPLHRVECRLHDVERARIRIERMVGDHEPRVGRHRHPYPHADRVVASMPALRAFDNDPAPDDVADETLQLSRALGDEHLKGRVMPFLKVAKVQFEWLSHAAMQRATRVPRDETHAARASERGVLSSHRA
jgi:hypothetical protein